MKNYIRQVFLGIDQLINSILGGNSIETISSRCWRMRSVQPYSAVVTTINKIVFWQNNHCRGAYNKFVERCKESQNYNNITLQGK